MGKLLNGSVIGAIIGAIISAALTAIITANIYKKQLLENQYLAFVDEVDKVVFYSQLLESKKSDIALKAELELSLNKAWAKAFIVLPDDDFLEIDKLFSRKSMNKAARNRIYHIFRVHLNPKTKIKYDDYMDKFISIRSVERIRGSIKSE